jgi:hypothetical protein
MGSFARPTDVELRSKVVRNTVLFGLDASFDPDEATAFTMLILRCAVCCPQMIHHMIEDQ